MTAQPRWQCVAIYEVSNDPGFFGEQTVISSEFKAAISADSVSLSSVVMDLVIRHVSSMMLMLTITNRDQTRRGERNY